MALQTDGPISISDVAAEFGAVLPQSLFQLAQLAGIPTPVSLTDFYGLSAFTPYDPTIVRNTNVHLDVQPSILSASHTTHSPVHNETYVSDNVYALTDGGTAIGGLHIFDNNTDGTLTYRETIISDTPDTGRRFTGLNRFFVITGIVVSDDGQHMYVPEFTNRSESVTRLPGRIHHFVRSGNTWTRNTIITPTISGNATQDSDSSIGSLLATNSDGSRLFVMATEIGNVAGAVLWVYDRIGTSFVERSKTVRQAGDGSTLQTKPLPLQTGSMQCNASGDTLVISTTAQNSQPLHEVVTIDVSATGQITFNNLSGAGEFGIITVQLSRDLLSHVSIVDNGNADNNLRFNLQYFTRTNTNSTFTLADTKLTPDFPNGVYASNGVLKMSLDGEYVCSSLSRVDANGQLQAFADIEVIYLDGNTLTTTAVEDGEVYTTNVGNNRAPNPLPSGRGAYVYDAPDGNKALVNFWLDFVLKDSNLYLAQFK